MDILVTYDISTADEDGERRLRNVAQVCEGFGLRVQKSVFECRLSSTGYQRLLIELADRIDPTQDSVRLYRFDGTISNACETLGIQNAPNLDGNWIV